MKIDRTLFWFIDGENQLNLVNDDFFGIATLLNRLMNETYDGKKIKFINIEFLTDRTYTLYPILPKGKPYYNGGHLKFYGSLDLSLFNSLDWSGKKHYVWENACKYLLKSAEVIKNTELANAITFAYRKGLDINLEPDYRLLEMSVDTLKYDLKATLWIKFKKDGMYSIFTLEHGAELIFEKEIDKSRKGIEFFLELYKAMDFDGRNIVIKGQKDVDYLPLTIVLPQYLFG